jgi:uncharacterized protein YgbK (DUF1537 family)
MKSVPENGIHIAVIADDLTGANDTGVQFAKQGLSTVVLMGAPPSSGGFEEDVVVVDSQSRASSPEEAYRNVAKAARLFRNRRFHVVFKKIDSTLRGNIGREIDAIMDICGQEVAVVAPAFPKNGRTTVGGYHLLQGAPLESTELARDLKCPVTESHLPTLLSRQTLRKVGHVGIKSVLAGADGILDAMEAASAAGDRVIVCDAWRDEHLAMHAEAAMRLGKPVLWVGSAGLAECLPRVLGLVAAARGRRSDRDDPAGRSTVVVLAGSVSDVTRGQLRMLERRPGVESVEADPRELLRKETAAGEIRRCLEAVVAAAGEGRDVVVSSGYSQEVVDRTMEAAASMGLSSQRTAEEIAAAFGILCREIAMRVKLKGLVLTGGDIALSSCSRLSATGFSVVEEVAPGIPAGLLKGGLCDGLRVVTKAGAFGDEDALCRAVDCLKRDRMEVRGR